MGTVAGGPFRRHSMTGAALALALALAGCAGGASLAIFDLSSAKPPAMRPVRAQIQIAGLTRSLAGGGATADYELDLDIRAFEFDAPRSEVHVDVAARIVSLGDGRVAAVEIFTVREPVASSDPAAVAAALDRASLMVMARIVAFVARRL